MTKLLGKSSLKKGVGMNPMNEVTLRDILEYGYYVRELSDDQLTGGVYSELWRYKYVYYELVWDDREVIHWEMYNEEMKWGSRQ